MKEKHISTYITSIFLLLSLTLIAQETAKDSLGYQQRYGLRIGIDLSKPIRSFLNDNYRGLELMGDYRLTQRHYIAAEIGTEENTIEDEYISFSSKGNYLKVGFDYNTYENWYGMENMILQELVMDLELSTKHLTVIPSITKIIIGRKINLPAEIPIY